MTIPVGQFVDTTIGRTSTNPFITIIMNRAPTGNDGINNKLQVGQRWIDTLHSNEEWFLLNFISYNGVVQANWVQIGAGAMTLETLTGNSGGAVGPDTSHNINVVGDGTTINIVGNPATHTLTASLVGATVPGYSAASITVSPIVGHGDFTTIGAALAAATAGMDILIKVGVYTEDITLKAGVSLVAWEANAIDSDVVIAGNCTFSDTGVTVLSGIFLRTNGNFCLSVTGSNFSTVWLIDCVIFCSNHTGISFTSTHSDSVILIKNCEANIATTGIAYYSSSSLGRITITKSYFGNFGASTTPSINSAGLVIVERSFITSPLSVTGGILGLAYSSITTEATNVPCLSISGSSSCNSEYTLFDSGTASAIIDDSIFKIQSSAISSTNALAIDGTGTISYAELVFPGSSSIINPTLTKNILPSSQLDVIDSSPADVAISVLNTNTASTAQTNMVVGVSPTGLAAFDNWNVSGNATKNWSAGLLQSSGSWILQQGASPTFGSNPVIIANTDGLVTFPRNDVNITRSQTAGGPQLGIQNINATPGATARVVIGTNAVGAGSDNYILFDGGGGSATAYEMGSQGSTSDFVIQTNAANLSPSMDGTTAFSISAANLVTVTSALAIGAAGPTITSGTGAPTSSQPQGSLYLRTDGSGVNNRAYINTNGATTWTAIVTVA